MGQDLKAIIKWGSSIYFFLYAMLSGSLALIFHSRSLGLATVFLWWFGSFFLALALGYDINLTPNVRIQRPRRKE